MGGGTGSEGCGGGGEEGGGWRGEEEGGRKGGAEGDRGWGDLSPPISSAHVDHMLQESPKPSLPRNICIL